MTPGCWNWFGLSLFSFGCVEMLTVLWSFNFLLFHRMPCGSQLPLRGPCRGTQKNGEPAQRRSLHHPEAHQGRFRSGQECKSWKNLLKSSKNVSIFQTSGGDAQEALPCGGGGRGDHLVPWDSGGLCSRSPNNKTFTKQMVFEFLNGKQ